LILADHWGGRFVLALVETELPIDELLAVEITCQLEFALVEAHKLRNAEHIH
jgi:hypothetical protein